MNNVLVRQMYEQIEARNSNHFYKKKFEKFKAFS